MSYIVPDQGFQIFGPACLAPDTVYLKPGALKPQDLNESPGKIYNQDDALCSLSPEIDSKDRFEFFKEAFMDIYTYPFYFYLLIPTALLSVLMH